MLFAALFTGIGCFEVFFDALGPHYGQATALTLRVPYSARLVRNDQGEVFDVSFTHKRIVIARGTVLDPSSEDHQVAVEFQASRRPPQLLRIGGAFFLYFFGCLILTSYFQRFGHSRLRLLRSQTGLFFLMALVIGMSKLLLVLTAFPAFWIPVSAIAFWTTLGFDRRTALLVDVAISFFVTSLLRFDLLLLTVFFTRGIVATLVFLNRKQPRQMVFAGMVAGLAAGIAYIALVVVLEGKAGLLGDMALGIGSEIGACILGGVLSGVLATVLREPAESILGHVSRSKLLDLTDIEAPLLRKMATEAPGSWEHSRAMANLAEAAAASIGADSLLTRVGAYYHDLGKTVQAKFFVENLGPNERSPHEDLEPQVSADAIMAHVVLGTKILREGGVPEAVVEFAYTHHGTQLVEFFWNKHRQAVTEAEERGVVMDALDESHFRYPGMKPMTKETAILMLVDSIEAASRTIKPPEHDKFEEMIQKVVFTKVKAGQLDESGLNIGDLRVMTERLAATLVNMYHGRIKYPWQRKKEKEQAEREGSTGGPPPVGPAPPTAANERSLGNG